MEQSQGITYEQWKINYDKRISNMRKREAKNYIEMEYDLENEQDYYFNGKECEW